MRGSGVALAIGALSLGCIGEIHAGGYKAGGGVDGLGWSAGVSFGTAVDIGSKVRIGAGGEAEMGTVAGKDGDLKNRSVGANARVDVAVDDKGTKRFTVVGGYARFGDLRFGADATGREYTRRLSTRYSVFAGFAGETEANGSTISLAFGPSVHHYAGAFVGDNTWVGGQLRLAFIAFPTIFTGHRDTGPSWWQRPSSDGWSTPQPTPQPNWEKIQRKEAEDKKKAEEISKPK